MISSRTAFGAGAFAALVLTVFGTAMAAEPAPSCKVQKIVELPVTMIGARPTVPVTINGQPARFMIDTGGFFNTMSFAAAEKFHLKPADDARISGVFGVGGFTRAQVAIIREFGLAGVPLPRIEVVVADGLGPDIDGIIGENILHSLDVEYDFANGAVRIYKPQHCDNKTSLAYWATTGLSILDLVDESISDRHIFARGELNGRNIRLMFDTGFPRSYVTLKTAEAVGVKPDTPGVVSGGQISGFGSRRLDTWIGRFDNLKLDGEEIQHTRLRFGGGELLGAQMVLGADFFLSHRIYVANSQHRIYFTYNGGQVFQLESTPQIQRAETAAAAGGDARAPGTGSAKADVLTDPDALARRGAASLARFDYPAAIADFTQAIALKPDDGVFRLRRGQAYLRAGNRALAKADFDAAAKLIPLTSPDSLQVTGAYQGLGLLRESIDHASLWINANPKSDLMWQALNSRGYARARLRTELDMALEDCNGALKLMPGNVNLLDSRAYTHFVRGELDASLADYDIVLKQQPKTALALYSRGVIKLRKGLKDAGNADIVAAIALNPQVAQQAKSVGLAP